MRVDARERGLSYSGDKPSAQLGVVWDGEVGGYAGASLTYARFAQRSGAALRAYAGRVFGLGPGVDAEVGLLAHRFENVSNYDFVEAYTALLGERWNLRAYASPDYYGIGQRSLYGEANLNWPLTEGVAAVGHVGVLRGWGTSKALYVDAHGPARVDWRAGLSFHLGESSELQLAWVAASRGGPYTWIDVARRRTAVLNLTIAF